MRIIALFNLKPGVSVSDYESWAKTVDIPTVNGLPSIDKFELFRTTGLLGSDARAPYSYIEIIDVNDMEQFGKDAAMPVMQAISASFQGMANVSFLTTEPVLL
jgi:hypothetical protein